MNVPDMESIRAFFMTDRFAAGCGITIEAAREEGVECRMPVTCAHLNAGGSVQGGAIFTLADFTFAVHANLPLVAVYSSAKETGEVAADVGIVVAQSNSISFLSAPRGAFLRSRSVCLSRGRSVSVFCVSVFDAEGRHVAEMTGNGVQRTLKQFPVMVQQAGVA